MDSLEIMNDYLDKQEKRINSLEKQVEVVGWLGFVTGITIVSILFAFLVLPYKEGQWNERQNQEHTTQNP